MACGIFLFQAPRADCSEHTGRLDLATHVLAVPQRTEGRLRADPEVQLLGAALEMIRRRAADDDAEARRGALYEVGVVVGAGQDFGTHAHPESARVLVYRKNQP